MNPFKSFVHQNRRRVSKRFSRHVKALARIVSLSPPFANTHLPAAYTHCTCSELGKKRANKLRCSKNGEGDDPTPKSQTRAGTKRILFNPFETVWWEIELTSIWVKLILSAEKFVWRIFLKFNKKNLKKIQLYSRLNRFLHCTYTLIWNGSSNLGLQPPSLSHTTSTRPLGRKTFRLKFESRFVPGQPQQCVRVRSRDLSEDARRVRSGTPGLGLVSKVGTYFLF